MIKLKLFLFACLVFSLAACGGDDDGQILENDIQTIKTYLSTNNLTAIETASGLHYIIENPGVGISFPNSNSNVTVGYKGYLTDGTEFDASTTPVTFSLNAVIQGWQEGIPFFKPGGKGKLFIPSSLGYKDNPPANSVITENAVLIFDIELIDFN